MQGNQRIRELFDAAVDLPGSERIPFLLTACRGDDRLFAEVARLVAAYQESEEPPPESSGSPGQVLGAYQIIRDLGRGGMGAVYLARRIDGTFERQVALKLVRPDRMTDGAIERFGRERRLLASLAHPGICRLLDAGAAEDGQPYFVMEYVDGVPITEYCDRRLLCVRDRVRLFAKVCDAVSSAHRVPIVHCDLKPRNLLVGADGEPRVLDFGIATALTPGGREAEPPLDPYGSPRYASPEQLRGEPVHTTSDIYSLGVVLFELLVGIAPPPNDVEHPPCRPSSLIRKRGDTTALAVERPDTIATMRGTNPDGLRRALAGDLDAIVMKCLQSEPGLRYQSVDALADDLHRYLGGRPVLARPQRLFYVARRFAARHPWAVASAAAAAILLTAAVLALTLLWQRAERERQQAQSRFADLRSLATSLFDIDAALSNVPGATPARQQILESASAYLDRLGSQSPADPELSLDVAEGHRRVGDMLGNPNVPNLGRREDALKRYDAAARILAAAGIDPTSASVQALMARIETSRADVLFAQHRLADSRAAYERAAAILDALAIREPQRVEYRRSLAGVFRPLGDAHLAEGDAGQALRFYEKARALDLALQAERPADIESQRQLALTQLRVGDAAGSLGQTGESIAAYREALRLLAGASERGTGRSDLLRDAAMARLRLGQLTMRADPAAGSEMLQALTAFRELALRDPRDAEAQRDLLVALTAYADAIVEREPDEARRLVLEARRIAERLAPDPVRDSRAQRDLSAIAARLARGRASVPEVSIAVIRDGREVPLERGTRPPGVGDLLRVSWRVNPRHAQYLLMLGGDGPPTLHSAEELDAAGWQVRASGPLPSQTLLVVDLQDEMSPAEREAFLVRIGRVAGPRSLDSEAHILWPSGEMEPVDASYRARGDMPGWVRALREELAGVPGLTYAGRTFALDALR